jgi:murein DD-endopeptidase MepM/ murein hydrolase activator NlpD
MGLPGTRVRLVVAGLTAALVLHGVVAGHPTARAASESTLAARAADEARRLSAVSGDLATAQRSLDRLDADLSARRSHLAAVQSDLAHARARLTRLRLRADLGRGYLARVLVARYESDPPDIVTVILHAKGFADLIEQVDNAERVARSDANAVAVIRRAHAAVAVEARKLDGLQRREQQQLVDVVAREEAATAIRSRLARRQIAVEQAHAHTVGALRALRARRRAVLARQAASRRAANAALAPAAGAILTGGGFTFPMPANAAAPPSNWSPDQGVDISAPGHTPLLAVGDGTIVGHGISGFGNDAPILKLDDGRVIYYGHAGPGNAVPVGTHVRAGQVISEVGDGIVGISTGPHLEIGFCDVTGNPVGPQTAGTMMALLRAAYGA